MHPHSYEEILKTSYCKQCGICCTAIPIARSKKQLKAIIRRENGHKDASWVLSFWKRISWKKARELNPDMSFRIKGLYYYSCSKLKDGKCSAYFCRPYICKRYPLENDRGLHDPKFQSSLINKTTCGYLKAISDYERIVKETTTAAKAEAIPELKMVSN